MGDSYKQLAEQAKGYIDIINSPVDYAHLEEASKALISNTKQQYELGLLTAGQAEDRVIGIAKDSRVTVETQQAAQKELTGLQKTEGDRRTADVKAQLDESQALIQAHRLGQSEGEQRLTTLKRQQLQIQLQDVEKELAAEATAVAQGRGSSTRVRELTNTQATLQAQLKANAEKGQDDRYKAEELHYADQQKLLDGSLATGNLTEEQYNQKSLANTQAKTAAELQDVQRRRSLLNKTDKQGLEDLAAEEAGIRKQQEEALQKFENAQVSIIERAQKKAVDAATLSETERLTQIQKLDTAHTITHEQAEQQRTDATGEFLKKRLQAENKAVIELEKLPKVDDPIKQEQNQEKITAAKIKAAQTARELAANELRQQEEAQKVYEELLNQRVQAVKNAAQSENIEYTRQEDYLNAISKSLDNQGKLLQIQKEIQTSIFGYYETIAGVLEKTATNEEERKDIAETAAAIRLRSVQAQYDTELKILDANVKQKEAQLEIDKLKNKAARYQNAADVIEAQAKVTEVTKRKD